MFKIFNYFLLAPLSNAIEGESETEREEEEKGERRHTERVRQRERKRGVRGLGIKDREEMGENHGERMKG